MYIYQNSEWPNFRWDEKLIMQKLVAVHRAAGFLAGRFSSIGFDAQNMATVERVTSDIVSSSEIEGVQLNSDQVRSSVARRMGVRITNETEPTHYIDGIVEMMIDASSNFSSRLTEERLFGWHNCLFPNGFSGLEKINVGMFRKDPMDVISGTLGRAKIHYHAPDAEKVPAEIAVFLDWFNSDDTPRDYIKPAIAHLWFVSIHPFDDGNGRISRAIADMALSQADNSPIRYFSMSRQINKEKSKYNEIIEKCQKGNTDITRWIDWYLDCMLRSIESASEMLSKILDKAVFWQIHEQTTIAKRQRDVLNIYLDGYNGKLTTKNWAKHAKVSLDTAARDIKDLIGKDILIPQPGKVRDVSYGILISEGNVLVPGPIDEE